MKSSSPYPGHTRPKRKSFGPFFLGLFIVGLLAAIAIPLYLGYTGMMKGSTPQTAQQFTASSPGAQAQIALEVTSLSSQTTLTGNLLQKNGDGSYSRTGKTVSVKWNSAKIVMGSSSDVKVGAVLQANGMLGTDNVLTADQLVILTGFAQVK
jgi:hypothetical protein